MPARDVLLDTGPLVAALDRRDQWHDRCVEAWANVIDRCVTTEAVLTEASHLVHRGGASAAVPLEFLLTAGIPILGLERAQHRHAASLMARYADLPMDYADASLVAVGVALKLTKVFTTDRRGFGTYQLTPRRRFEMLPT